MLASVLRGSNGARLQPQPTSGPRHRKAYEQAGIGPEDLSVAEVHDASAMAKSSRRRTRLCRRAKAARWPNGRDHDRRPHPDQSVRWPGVKGHPMVPPASARSTNW